MNKYVLNFVVACLMGSVGCVSVGNSPELLSLKLLEYNKEFPPGSVSFKVLLISEDKTRDTEIHWFHDEVERNFFVMVKPETDFNFGFHPAEFKNSAFHCNSIIKRGISYNFNLMYTCTLRPGDYEICLCLIDCPGVKTKWYKVTVLPGKLYDMRYKGERSRSLIAPR
jgi:hypothetical protein